MDELIAAVLPELIRLRHALHQEPELSGEEAETAARIAELLTACSPDELHRGVGGHGVIAVFGDPPGPTVTFAAQLDQQPFELKAEQSLS